MELTALGDQYADGWYEGVDRKGKKVRKLHAIPQPRTNTKSHLFYCRGFSQATTCVIRSFCELNGTDEDIWHTG